MNVTPTPATEAVREIGKSFPFLFGTICYTLALIMTLVSSLFSGVNMAELYNYGGGDISYIGGWTTGISLIGMIPAIIMVTGMWLLLAACASKKPVPSTGGITLVRGAVITYIVLMSICLGLVVILACIFIFAGAMAGAAIDYEYSAFGTSGAFRAGMEVMVLAFAIVIALLILLVIYYVKMLKTTKVIRNVLRTGSTRENISMFLIVFNFISIAGTVISIIMTLINAPYISGVIPSVIQSLLSLISIISITVSLLMLRGRLSDVM